MLLALSVKVSGQYIDDELFDLSLEELMNIEVFSSNKKAESLIETPAAINVVTGTSFSF